MGSIKEIVFDCEKAAALARFWAQLLDGYEVSAYIGQKSSALPSSA